MRTDEPDTDSRFTISLGSVVPLEPDETYVPGDIFADPPTPSYIIRADGTTRPALTGQAGIDAIAAYKGAAPDDEGPGEGDVTDDDLRDLFDESLLEDAGIEPAAPTEASIMLLMDAFEEATRRYFTASGPRSAVDEARTAIEKHVRWLEAELDEAGGYAGGPIP